jgi:hypothetical protein
MLLLRLALVGGTTLLPGTAAHVAMSAPLNSVAKHFVSPATGWGHATTAITTGAADRPHLHAAGTTIRPLVTDHNRGG